MQKDDVEVQIIVAAGARPQVDCLADGVDGAVGGGVVDGTAVNVRVVDAWEWQVGPVWVESFEYVGKRLAVALSVAGYVVRV